MCMGKDMVVCYSGCQGLCALCAPMEVCKAPISGRMMHSPRRKVVKLLIAGGLILCCNLCPKLFARQLPRNRGEPHMIAMSPEQGEYISQVFEATRVESVKVLRPEECH